MVVLSVGGNDTPNLVSDFADDVKQVGASFVYGGTFQGKIIYVEGCGGVGPNSPLWACTCSGSLPSFP